MRSPRDDPATRSGGASRLFKAVLVAYLVVVSAFVIVVVVTEGLGKSAVAAMLALITGIILWFRERESSTRD
jgi:Flp pilus assembly protein TadB